MTKPNPWFDKIGLSYANNFDEVETARGQFELQRDLVLDRLSEVAGGVLKKAKLKVVGEPVRDVGWDNWFIAGSWAKSRRELGKRKGEWQSGICFGIEHDPLFETHGGARFGFGAYVFFAMSQDRYNRLRPTFATAAKAHGCVVDFWSGDDIPCACLRSAWILPGTKNFSLGRFEQEVTRLPVLFTKTDHDIDAAYVRTKGG